ncbi:MAG: hypothetical protein ACKOEM_08655 [Planctomycetia bacterium]
MPYGLDRAGEGRKSAAVRLTPLPCGRPTAWRGGPRSLTVVGVALVVSALACGGRAADPFYGADPVWSLLHEPAVARELTLSASQQRHFRTLLDEFDARFFPLRNRSGDDAARNV